MDYARKMRSDGSFYRKRSKFLEKWNEESVLVTMPSGKRDISLSKLNARQFSNVDSIL